MEAAGRWAASVGAGALLLAVLAASGCGTPSKANISLRKEKQAMQGEIASLKDQLSAANARIEGLERRATTVPTLPQEQLSKMFTVRGLEIGRLSGGVDLDPKRPGDEGVKVYMTPVDQDGDPVKATGKLVIEAHELGGEPQRLLGRWEFGPEEMKPLWRGFGMMHAFVATCPWQSPPARPEVAVRVWFQDQLTGAVYSKTWEIRVAVDASAGATRPSATQPASR